jgi:hypothetical protein
LAQGFEGAEEETMIRMIALPLALGFALAAPLSAAAYGPIHHPRPIHHRNSAMRAEAPAPLTLLVPARTPAFGDNETDGLSRNPADCATYGCIDNGGD